MKAEIQENLINFKLSGSTRNVLFLMILIGIVSFVGGFFGLHLEARHPGAHSNPKPQTPNIPKNPLCP